MLKTFWTKIRVCFAYLGNHMPQRLPRKSDGGLDDKKISEAYALEDENGNVLCICVRVEGAWVNFPGYDKRLDTELKLLLRDRYTTRKLQALNDFQDKFEATVNLMQAALSSTRTHRP